MAYEPSTLRAALVGLIGGGQEFVNVFHGTLNPEADATSAGGLEFAEVVRDSYIARFLPILCNNVTLARVDWLTPGLTPAFGGSITASGTGGSASAPAPPNVACCISWQTGLAGRSYRGRTYLPGIGEDKVDGNGTLLNTFVTGVAAAAANFLSDISATGSPDLQLVVASKVVGVNTPVLGLKVGPRCDTQRRRLARTG